MLQHITWLILMMSNKSSCVGIIALKLGKGLVSQKKKKKLG